MPIRMRPSQPTFLVWLTFGALVATAPRAEDSLHSINERELPRTDLVAPPPTVDPLANPADYLSLDDIMAIPIDVASTRPQTILETPSTISVITRESIDRYNFRTISEALNSVTGVRVLRGVALRNTTTIRGIYQDTYTNKVLIMVDGIPVWDALTGDANPDRVSINEVERIEVLRGPASVLYGTNAYSGAVNIVLRKAPTEPGGTLTGGVGTFREFQSGAYYASPFDGGFFSVAAYSSVAKGHTEWITDNAGIHGRWQDFNTPSNFTARANYGSHDLIVNGYNYQSGFIGAALGRFSQGIGNPHEAYGWLVGYSYSKQLNEDLRLKLRYSYDQEDRTVSSSMDDLLRLLQQGKRHTIATQANYRFNNTYDLDAGVDLEHREAPYFKTQDKITGRDVTNFIPPTRVSLSYSAFSQVNAHFDKLTAVAGGRVTGSKDYSTDFSPRVTLLYALANKTSLKANYGRSFRIPSIRESLSSTNPASPFALGNPDLKPESNTTYELALVNSFESLFTQALVYYSEYNGRVYRRATPFAGYPNQRTYTNAPKTHASGVDLDVQFKNPGWIDVLVGYSYVNGAKTDVVDADGYYAFKMVPRNLWQLGALRAVGNWDFSALYLYTGKTTGPVRGIASQGSLDLNISRKHRNARHSIKLVNALNERLVVPDYIIRGTTVNEVPLGKARQLFYTFSYNF
jgi:outer membrane receptor protein involved in Fe transport